MIWKKNLVPFVKLFLKTNMKLKDNTESKLSLFGEGSFSGIDQYFMSNEELEDMELKIRKHDERGEI